LTIRDFNSTCVVHQDVQTYIDTPYNTRLIIILMDNISIALVSEEIKSGREYIVISTL
jgi:hypothetical protein